MPGYKADAKVALDSKLDKFEADEMFKNKFDKLRGKALEKSSAIINQKIIDLSQEDHQLKIELNQLMERLQQLEIREVDNEQLQNSSRIEEILQQKL